MFDKRLKNIIWNDIICLSKPYYLTTHQITVMGSPPILRHFLTKMPPPLPKEAIKTESRDISPSDKVISEGLKEFGLFLRSNYIFRSEATLNFSLFIFHSSFDKKTERRHRG